MDTEVLHRAIDELAGQDLSELCDAEVHELTIGLARAGGRLDGVLFSALDVWDARGIWSDDGSKSPAARLAREANWSQREASMAIRRARNLRRLPATAAAVTAGDLSAEFVDLVHRASQVDLDVPFSECETAIVDGCVEAGYAESKDAIGRWIDAVDPDAADERARKRLERRGISAATTIDGMVHVNGLLTAVGGQIWLAELRRLESKLYADDVESGNVRTAHQRRGDALEEMARRSAGLDAAEAAAGKPARIVVSVVMGPEPFAQLCELASGTPVTPGELVPFLDQLDVERIIFGSTDRVLSVSHRRSFPAAVRRAIEIRDRRCTHPSGCDEPAVWCDTDHVVEHASGGETSETNGRLLCMTHNRNRVLRDRAPAPGTPRTRRPPPGWTFPVPSSCPDRRNSATGRPSGDRGDGDGGDDPDHS
jgi:hypothetical protein